MVGYVRKEDKVMRYTVVLERDARVIVPDHKVVRLGTLRRIIADADLTVERFLQLLQRR